MNRTLLVIPCFNEEQRLDPVRLERFVQEQADVGLCLVDDGSTDRTLELLHALERAHPERMTVCALPENRGKAEAVRVGVLHALEQGPEFVGYWDADLATPLEELPRFLEHLRARPELLLVMGSRVQLLGRHIERKAVRHYGGRVVATLIARALGAPVYDTQCGAKLFRCGDEVSQLFAEPFCVGWTFDVELLARITTGPRGGQPLGRSVHELPLFDWRDVGASKVRARDFLRSLVELARIRKRYLSRSRR